MHDREWEQILNEIDYENLNQNNILDKTKEKLRIRYPDVYNEWKAEKNKFHIDHLFQFQNLKCTLLHIAAYYNKVNTINDLLEIGANINSINEDGETPLHLATENNCIYAVKILLKSEDINTNIRDKIEKIPLHWAAALGRTDIVMAILTKKGAKINVADKDGKTPLHWAIENNHIDIAKALLNNGAKVDIIDRYRKTPLHRAALFGSIDAVKVLLDKNANPLLQDWNGKNPRKLSQSNDIKQLLEKAENRQLLKLTIGVITGCATAILGTVTTMQLVKNETVNTEEMPIQPTVVIISLAALAVGSMMYKIYEPSTKIYEMIPMERCGKGISAV